MSDFRGPLPLHDRDFAEVRRNVLGRIERRSPVIPLTLAAAAAVIALVIVLIPRQPAAVPKAVTRRPATVVVATPAPAPVKVVEKPKPKRKPQPQQIASAGAPPPDSEITMNIETADPNVRIIWISR